MKTGILIESLKVDIKEGIKKARDMNVDGIQFFAVSGDTAPENLSKEKRRELLKYIKDSGLEVSAICGDFSKSGFSSKKTNSKDIEYSKRILELAKDLETNIVTTHVSLIPSDKNHERYKIMQEACSKLGKAAKEIDGFFALETGPEKAQTMKEFIEEADTENIKVNYDPANLAMVSGDDPVKGVYILKDYIIHTHVKDGIRKMDCDIEEIYDKMHKGELGDIKLNDIFEEKILGKGAVDFYMYFSALKEIGYNGYLTIERETGEDREKDIRYELEYMKKILKKI